MRQKQKQYRRLAACVYTAAALFALTACQNEVQSYASTVTVGTEYSEVEPEETLEETLEETEEETEEETMQETISEEPWTAEGKGPDLNLFRQFSDQKQNFVFSPYSIRDAFSLLFNGTFGDQIDIGEIREKLGPEGNIDGVRLMYLPTDAERQSDNGHEFALYVLCGDRSASNDSVKNYGILMEIQQQIK